MAKQQEERFNGYASTYELRAYIRKKLRSLAGAIANGTAKDTMKTGNYIVMLEDILELPYYESCPNVFYLLHHLKEVTMEIDDRLKMATEEVERLRERADEINLAEAEEGYLIPDEESEYLNSLKEKARELWEEIILTEADIEALQREKQLCNNLKGIICRPEGFFKNL